MRERGSILTNITNKIFKSRDKPQNGFFLFGGTSSGKTVNERTSMQATSVYACVRILAESIASLPFNLLESTAEGDTRKAKTHPLYYILHDEPNPEMTSFVFRETIMVHLLLWGNAYAQIIRDGRGKVLALYPLLPDRMHVDRAVNGELFYSYRTDSGEAILRKDEVFHIPGLGFDGLVGYSPIAMVKNAIGIALATEEFGAKFFANGAMPGGVLEHPVVVKDPKRIRESWNALFQGGGNAHRVAVLEEGMKYHAIGIPPDQAQFLETRKFQTNEIARIFRVPPHMIGDLEKSSFNNIEQQSLEFVKYTLDPWLARWEQAVRKDLLLPSEKSLYYARLNVDGLLRGDFENRMRGYAVARQNGWMSSNDILRMEDTNLIPTEDGGDLYLVNGNMVKLAEAGAAYKNKKNGGEK